MLKRLVLVSLVAAIALPLPAQDESFSDEIRQLMQEGTDLYKRGKYQESYAKFEKAFQMKPSSDLVYAYMKRVGEDLVAGMMNSPDRQMQDVGKRLYEMAKPGEPYRPGDKVVIQKYIDELRADDYAVWRNAFWHLKNFGSYAVRFLIPVLNNKLQDRDRSRVILLLTEMGLEASPAMVECLESKDPFLRQQAAIILGNVKDDRAIPALKRVYEDANEPAEVKKYANEALRKIIRGKDPAQWKKATDYYYELAMKYYYSHSSVILAWQRHYLLWKWNKEGDKDILTERKVARMVYNEQLAEEALYDLLELDPNYVDPATKFSAWSLLACVHFAQAIESRAAVEAALDAYKSGEDIDKPGLVRLIKDLEGMSDASIEPLGKAITDAASVGDVQSVVMKYFDKQAKVIRANVLGELPGKAHLYESLARSLADSNYLVAKASIEVIEEMGRPEDLPAPKRPEGQPEDAPPPPTAGATPASAVDGTMGHPLIEALTNEDKRVRYAAAKAMVTLNTQRPKLGMELVIPNLVDALGEQGVRVALVIYDVQDESDRNFINTFRKTLIGINIFPVFASSGAEGIIKAKQFPTEDVILIQKKICGQVYFRESDIKTPVTESVFDTLRDDIRTKNIPRIVLADTATEVEEAKAQFLEKGTALGVVTKEVPKLELQAMLEKIFDLPEAKKDAKDRADEISRAAAETLSRIDITNTLYPFGDAVPALIDTVSPKVLREDFIRIPSARALGRFADQRGVDVLALVLNDKDADAEKVARQKAVRWESVKALSRIFQVRGGSPTEDVFRVLMANIKDGDYDIELTSGEALGNAKLTHEQRLTLSKHRRIVRETYTHEDP